MEELLLKKIEQIEAENKRLRKKIKTLEEKIEVLRFVLCHGLGL